MVISLFYTNKKLIFLLNTDAKVLLSSPYSYHISKIKNHKYLTYSKTEFFAFKNIPLIFAICLIYTSILAQTANMVILTFKAELFQIMPSWKNFK